MRKMLGAILATTIVGALPVVMGGVAEAHQCSDAKEKKNKNKDNCHETPVYEDWRPNYIPLFDLPDREEQGEGTDGEQQRRDAQRWRDECADDGEERQQCAWVYGGTSAQEYPTDVAGPRPNELHVGYAANHCFLAEGAHDCDSHEESEFGTHDSHGGAIYVDICVSENPDSKRCDDGVEDTQAGVTVVDHRTCPAGCADEYHVVRPADTAYTTEQMEDSAVAIERIVADPRAHVCGYEGRTSCPE